MNQSNNEELVLVQKQKNTAGTVATIVVFIWMMLGVLGFITSLVCFAYAGSFQQNWTGFLTAIVAGPLYWIYFLYAGDSYCKSQGKSQVRTTVQSITKKVMGGKKKGK
jgi:uncharacterized membrane protein (DUF106 family)